MYALQEKNYIIQGPTKIPAVAIPIIRDKEEDALKKEEAKEYFDKVHKKLLSRTKHLKTCPLHITEDEEKELYFILDALIGAHALIKENKKQR